MKKLESIFAQYPSIFTIILWMSTIIFIWRCHKFTLKFMVYAVGCFDPCMNCGKNKLSNWTHLFPYSCLWTWTFWYSYFGAFVINFSLILYCVTKIIDVQKYPPRTWRKQCKSNRRPLLIHSNRLAPSPSSCSSLLFSLHLLLVLSEMFALSKVTSQNPGPPMGHAALAFSCVPL